MFCTIDPNKAKVDVPDSRFDKLCEIYNPKSKVAAWLSILDIAGLVKGASQNAGMGNAFLSHIQAVDGIYHVCRAFDDEDVPHFEGDVDPIRDLEIIQGELIEKDKASLLKNIDDLDKQINRVGSGSGGCELKAQKATLDKVSALYEQGKNIRDVEDWSWKEIEILNDFLFFTAKPMVYLVNITKNDYINKKNKWLAKIVKWVNEHGGGKIIPYSVAFEQEYEAAENKAEFVKTHGVDSALGKIINSGYECLDLCHYFTAGADEVKCWTFRKGTLAPQAAGIIHSDFERGFISAEVMKYDDIVLFGNENNVKKEGKVETKGKTYEVQDGDIILFKFNVSDPKKKK
jgi:obg-like ATPase 1